MGLQLLLRAALPLALVMGIGCSSSDDDADGKDAGSDGAMGGDGDLSGDGDTGGDGDDPKQDPGPRQSEGDLQFSCGSVCSSGSVGPSGKDAFDIDMDMNERVSIDDDGALVLNREAGPSGPSVIWIADQGSIDGMPAHTVLKVDTETMQQLARYRVGPDGREDPSRTAVDIDGNVYVGNRGGEAATWQNVNLMSVTKVINQGCPDQDGDGVVTTSTGPDDVLPWGQDECVAWHVPFPHDVRAIAAQDVPSQVVMNPDGEMLIPAEHYVWVSGMNGTYEVNRQDQRATLRKLDARTGMTVLEIEAYPAYGMALDGMGNLWLDRGLQAGGVQRIDTTQCIDEASCDVDYCENTCNETDCTDQNDDCVKQLITGMPGGPGYGITVDRKQRVWIGGYDDDVLKIYDQNADADQRFTNGLVPGINGIAADGEGFVWGARRGGNFNHPNGNTLRPGIVRIEADDVMNAVTVDEGDAKGMAIDKQGKVWAISQSNYATVVVPGAAIDDNTVSRPVDNLSNPYTYSDMTGQQTRLASNDPGFYTRLIEGCDGSTNWHELSWDADIPENTAVRFSVRSADTIAELPAQTWINLAVAPPDVAPVMLPDAVDGKYLEIEVQLSSGDQDDLDLTPRVHGFGASYECLVLQ